MLTIEALHRVKAPGDNIKEDGGDILSWSQNILGAEIFLVTNMKFYSNQYLS